MNLTEAINAWFDSGNLHADILNTDFMVFVSEKTGAKTDWPFLGAPRVSGVGKALSAMYKDGALVRGRISLRNGPGFPNWIYVYERWDVLRHAPVSSA